MSDLIERLESWRRAHWCTKQLHNDLTKAITAIQRQQVEIVTPNEAAAINKEAAQNFKQAYMELIYAVGKKFPGESRHETALRYIQEAEDCCSGPAQADPPKGEDNG